MTQTDLLAQLAFFAGYDIRQAKPSRCEEIDRAFCEFHRANPQVWRLFVRFTLDVIAKGFKHYSSKSVFERIRWHTDIETGAADGFKLNNNYTAAYSRLFHEAYPEHADFFRLRARTSKARPARGASCGS